MPLPTPESLQLTPPAPGATLDWAALFGRAARHAIEIGTGNGYFIENEAARLADWDFIGIEREREFYEKMMRRCWRRGLTNVRTTPADALDVLQDWIPDGSVDRIYLYFSDPWPKRKHARRRVFGPDLLALAERLLSPTGELWFKTDVGWYFNLAVTAARRRPGWRLWDAARLPPPDPAAGEVFSNFESKARQAGSEVWGFHAAPRQRSQS